MIVCRRDAMHRVSTKQINKRTQNGTSLRKNNKLHKTIKKFTIMKRTIMKRTILLMSCLLIVMTGAMAGNVIGAITTNTSWTLANSPYIVTGNITVNAGITLTIEKGVAVKFNSGLGITVLGTLKARQAQFTSNVTPLAKGAWAQIQCGSSSYPGTITLDTCTVDYGGAANTGSIYLYQQGTVNLNGTNINNSSSSGLCLSSVSGGGTVNLRNTTISTSDWAILYNGGGNINNLGGNNLSGNKYDAANINFQNVTSNLKLSTLSIPYIVSQNLSISPTITMQVDSGVVLKFNTGLGIQVYGTLKARKAQFTSNVTPLAKGAWAQIQCGNSSYPGTITLDTCKIEYAGASSFGSVYANVGTITVNNTSITNSSTAGLQLNTGTVNLKNSSITLCDWPIVYTSNGLLHNNGGNTFTGNKHDAAYINFSSLAGAWNLELLSIPYVFYTDFTIYAAGNMSIASGNSLKCPGWIYVDGILNAVAAQNEKIVFTSVNNDNVGGDTNIDGAATVPTRGSWGGIYFRDASNDASCVMRRCNITYGGGGYRGGIVIENASPTIDSCSMANNYYGTEMRGISKPNFMNNIMASSTVVPIAMSFDSEPVFLNNSFSFSDNQYDAIGLLGGTLGANSHLIQRNVTGLPNVTYLMLGALTIPQNYTLTVDTGIVIKSQSYGIIVQGALIANGDAGKNQVIFTSVHDDNVGNPGDTNKNGTQTNPGKTDWYGITFEGTSDDTKCLLNYCQVRYATANQYYSSQYINGAVNAVNASPTISNCIIKDVNYGLVAFQASNPIVTNTEFINSLYTPISLSVSANPTFTNLKFTNNAWTALGIIGETVGLNGTIAKRNVAGYNNISYVLLGDMTINSGTNVTVSPGVVIKMQNNIYVNGGFKAEGLVNDSIAFTSINDDNFGNPKDTRSDGNATLPGKGNWGTIQFKATTDDAFSTFNYCKLLYGSNILTFTDAGNTIKNTTISDGYGNGLRIEGTSTPNCTEAVVIKNCTSDPISMSLTSNPLFNITSPLFKSLGNGSNGIKILEGNLSSNATLTKRDVGQIYNVAYIIETLTVMPNTTLTIGEGVVLKFPDQGCCNAPEISIVVNGALVAKGSAKSPIVFTSIKDDSKGGDTNGDGNATVPSKGNWMNIRFNSSSLDGTNELRNCIINYGGNPKNYNYIGVVSVHSAKLTIDSCRIEQSSTQGVGIFGSASPIIKNSEFNNITNTPIILSMFSTPTFANNKVSNIGINAIGVYPETYSSDATIPIRDFAGYSNMTYYLYSTCTINSGTHITIPKGIVFKSNSNDFFNISGRISIDGTATEPVVFTNISDDSNGNPFDTRNDGLTPLPYKGGAALTFQDISNDLSTIKFAVFNCFDRGINLLQASPSIQNCTFKNSNWGVVLNGVSLPAIDNNNFNNLTYTPLCLSLVSYPSSSVGNTISGSTYKAIGVLSEELVQDATLEKRNFGGINNIPYYFSGNYTVGTSVTLTVKPGVVSKFADRPDNYGAPYQLNVKRGLMALGGATPDSTIVFTSILDDFYGGDTNSDSTATSPNFKNKWAGINFEDVSLDNLCKLDHCIVKCAGFGYWGDLTGSAISMTAASPSITNCEIRENANGIVINGSSNPIINNCDFCKNGGYAINNVNKAFDIDAKNCWWGDNSGPTYTLNANGIGGKISDKVLYSPWKTNGSINPLMGDVSLNGSVQAYDASLVLQHVVSLITLNTMQKTVADVSGDGSITSYDASLILQNVAGINSTFPAEMNSPGVKNEVILSYGNVSKSADQIFSIPLHIENGNRSMALDIATTFDGAVLEPISVTSGKDIPNNLFVYNIDKTNGKILIGIAGTENLNNQAEVANINFRIVSNTSSNTVTTLGINQFKANETDYTLSSVAKVIQISDLASSVNSVSTDNGTLSVYPNPLKSTSKVHFTVKKSGTNVTISLFDITGKQVDILVNGMQSAGAYAIDLNKMNRGVYLLKMISGNETQIQKVIVE